MFTVAYLSFGEGLEDSSLNSVCIVGQSHVAQHHHTTEQESSWVGQSLAGDIRSGTVNSLEDRALVSNVSRWSQSETTDQTGAHIGQNVSVQVGHDENLVVVWGGIGDDSQAGVIEEFSVEVDAREVLSNILGGVKEETVGHLHDGGLVDDADLLPSNLLSVLEGKSEDTLRCLSGDKLDTLHNTINNNVLNSGVFSLGVLSDKDNVNIVVWGLVAGNGSAGTEVGKEVEGSSECQVKRNMSLANGGLVEQLVIMYVQFRPEEGSRAYSERALQGNKVLLDTGNSIVWNSSLSVLQDGSNINWLPLDWYL